MNARSATTFNPSLSKVDDFLGLNDRSIAGSSSHSPQFFAIDFTELQPGQLAVCSMEISDGFTFPPDGRSYLDNENGLDGWQVFESFEEARQQAIQNVIANPKSECAIYDAKGRHVRTIRNGQPVPLEVLLATQPRAPKTWWQVWKS
jgi:hypothetical protein